MEDYRKLALEAAMKIPHQTHCEMLNSADKIYAWMVQDKNSKYKYFVKRIKRFTFIK